MFLHLYRKMYLINYFIFSKLLLVIHFFNKSTGLKLSTKDRASFDPVEGHDIMSNLYQRAWPYIMEDSSHTISHFTSQNNLGFAWNQTL